MSSTLDPRVIEQEIARIRDKESSPFAAGTKTNLFTLLVFRSGSTQDPADPVETSLQYLLGKRPARIITIARQPGSATEAWVSGRCFPDRRNRGVCFEEVRINAGDDGLGADPGAWAPLVIRDLPVFAWLPEGRSRAADQWRPTLKRAADLIDKLIVDSAREESGSPAVVPWLREMAGTTNILADFAWRRGKVLREQTARAFEPPEARALLSRVKSVRLYGGAAAEAELYFRWLSARLGRTLAEDHAFVGPLTEGFRVTIGIEGEKDVEIGCTRGGCLSRGDEKTAYRFPLDGEIL
ncbi:MAG TPA: glucose-6-phosphate dehydrogenase assembly protein OpcA, partial [bacterium]|nr:glucose-6-phosphate dehydrogenase assembly protein OpcA [bacterium]